jgi:hypothetical protein
MGKYAAQVNPRPEVDEHKVVDREIVGGKTRVATRAK